MEHPVLAEDSVSAGTEGVGPQLPPYPTPGDAPGAVAAEAAVRLGVSMAGKVEAGGATPRTGCVEDPIVIGSDVDTDDDSGTCGLTGRERPGWKCASAHGPVRSTAGRDSKAGMVGRVFHVYKGLRGPSVEVSSSPPVRPASALRDPTGRHRVAAPAGIPPVKRRCTGGGRS